MQNTKLAKDKCRVIWALVNPEGLDVFEKKMFIMCMALILRVKKGLEMPAVLGEDVLFSSDPDAYV